MSSVVSHNYTNDFVHSTSNATVYGINKMWRACVSVCGFSTLSLAFSAAFESVSFFHKLDFVNNMNQPTNNNNKKQEKNSKPSE